MSEVARLTQQQIDERIANIASFAAMSHRGYEFAAIAHVKFLLEVLAAPPAVWSREKPTEEGWYWWRRRTDTKPEVVWWDEFVSEEPGEWSGPLCPPVEGPR